MIEETQQTDKHPDSSNNISNQVIQPTISVPESAGTLQQQNPTPVAEPNPQTTTVVDVHSFTLTPSVSGTRLDQKPSRWRFLFMILGILQVAGIALFFLVMFILQGVPDGGFVALYVYMTLVPIVGIIAFINLGGLPIYILKYKPKGKGLVFSTLSLILSTIIFLYGSYFIYQTRVVLPNKLAKYSAQISDDVEKYNQQFTNDNTSPEISKEEAISLLKTCKLKGFYYTQEDYKEHGTTPATSSTGIVLTKLNGQPYRISIADRLIPELVPIARDAQKTCTNTQFWHDGTYEQYKDGKWYYKDEIVNITQSGKTKEEAVSFLEGCKADYFVGYTDINLVKDSNTVSWLNKAEKSTTGIEISDSSPKSYVFTSKVMTLELQNTVRQFRQSCYNSKKLYIIIDNWIETEYPIGKWTKVNL